MQLNQIKSKYFDALSELYPKSEIDSIFRIIVQHVLNYTKIDILTKSGQTINEHYSGRLLNCLTQLKTGRPVQYIVGRTEFYGHKIFVDPDVLIPRQETELMISNIDERYSKNHCLKHMDLCTGSGCIAIAIASCFQKFTVDGMDISAKALRVAKKNAKHNRVDIRFYEDDILDPRNTYEKYDLITANPPYVLNKEKIDMHMNVCMYEPGLALYVEDSSPLVFYNAIANFGSKHLNRHGLIYAEINENFGEETKQLFANKGYSHIEIQKDLKGKDRIIKAAVVY